MLRDAHPTQEEHAVKSISRSDAAIGVEAIGPHLSFGGKQGACRKDHICQVHAAFLGADNTDEFANVMYIIVDEDAESWWPVY
jgi:hypothetical protein